MRGLEDVKVPEEARPLRRVVQAAVARARRVVVWRSKGHKDTREGGKQHLHGLGARGAHLEGRDAAAGLGVDDGVPRAGDAGGAVAGGLVLVGHVGDALQEAEGGEAVLQGHEPGDAVPEGGAHGAGYGFVSGSRRGGDEGVAEGGGMEDLVVA